MKKRFSYILVLALVTSISFVLPTRVSHAFFDIGTIGNLITGGAAMAKVGAPVIAAATVNAASDFGVNMAANIISNVILALASLAVSISGILLNVSMFLTTHTGIFIDSTPVIYTVWGIIRDISSLLLIFFILWAAIQMILNIRPANYGELIKNIIIMGILINFSFFLTRVFIDASNIVSLEFYNAIAPGNGASLQCVPGPTNPCTDITKIMPALIKDGGISNIMMGAFKTTAWYNTKGLLADSTASFRIILLGATGSLIMIMAAFSFFAVAIACIVRLAMLVFLLGFSPIWIAAIAIPQLKEFSKQWTDHLKAQLIFLPVYLGIMYVSLKIITGSHLNSVSAFDVNSPMSTIINLFVAFVLMFFMINLPLFAAVKVAGSSVGWTDKMYKSMRGAVTGLMGRQSLGRVASGFNKYAENVNIKNPVMKQIAGVAGIGNSITARDVRGATTDKLTTSKFGSGRSFKDQTTLDKDIKKKDAELERRTQFNKALDVARISPTAAALSIKSALDKMNEKEKISLGKKELTKPEVLMHLKKSDFEAIKKAEEKDLSDSDKDEISDARLRAFNEAVGRARTDPSLLKHMVNNMDGSDLMKVFTKSPSNILNANTISLLNENQLKYMKENNLDPAAKATIFNTVQGQLAATGHKHPHAGWMQKNHQEWI